MKTGERVFAKKLAKGYTTAAGGVKCRPNHELKDNERNNVKEANLPGRCEKGEDEGLKKANFLKTKVSLKANLSGETDLARTDPSPKNGSN